MRTPEQVRQYQVGQHIDALRHIEGQYLPGGSHDVKGAIRASIAALEQSIRATPAKIPPLPVSRDDGPMEWMEDGWLADQLEQYPTRVHPDRTCCDGHVRRLAAQALREFYAALSTSAEAAWGEVEVERVARALCELRIRQVRRHDTPPEKIEQMMPAAVDYSWADFDAEARAALAALRPVVLGEDGK